MSLFQIKLVLVELHFNNQLRAIRGNSLQCVTLTAFARPLRHALQREFVGER
jgi:hypothetical protein